MDSSVAKVRGSFLQVGIFFIAMHTSYYVEQPYAVVLGWPSATCADQLDRNEKARIAEQVTKLGPEGLKEAERVLQAALAENGLPIPIETLTSFPVPDVKNISWIPVQSVQEPGRGRPPASTSKNSGLYKRIDEDGSQLPFFVEYDHVEVS